MSVGIAKKVFALVYVGRYWQAGWLYTADTGQNILEWNIQGTGRALFVLCSLAMRNKQCVFAEFVKIKHDRSYL